MQLKKQMIEKFLTKDFMNDSVGFNELKTYLDENPELQKYASFRTKCIEENCYWPQWKDQITYDDLSNPNTLFHCYVQYQIHKQLSDVRDVAHKNNILLNMTLPIGTHRYGYDPWAYQQEFIRNASIGAPPDIVFPEGQNWQIAPLNPLAIRFNHYHYFIKSLRTLMQQADIITVDHVMWMNHLFLIPDHLSAKEGIYVKYPTKELSAILAIESQKHKVAVIGENLGTVPTAINEFLKRQRVNSMYVLQYELESKKSIDIQKISRLHAASLNTHDMPPFAAYVQKEDIDRRVRLGIL